MTDPSDALALPIHPSHDPEMPGQRLVAHMTICRVCCRFVASDSGGVTARGAAECTGPARLRYSDDIETYAGSAPNE